MNFTNSKIMQGAVFLLAMLLTACGGGATGGGNTPGNPAPTVSSTSPANNAAGVALNSAITATFSEPVNVSSVSSASFTLNNGATGSVSCNGTTATFTPNPSSPLASGTTYTATITTGVESVAGTAMASPYTWTFTTGTVLDTIPPTVTSTSPDNGATDVATNAAITATFSEDMNASTVTAPGNFTLSAGSTTVPGTVTYNNRIATFAPTSGTLANGTLYTATITTSVQDLATNAMASARTWSFTTASGVTAPAITTQPQGATVAPGQTATFSVVATGSAPLSYQWQKGGAPIAGATSSSYTTPATTLADTGAQFTVVVSNSAGNATSNAAALTVQAATPVPDTVKIVFLHHSTGGAIYWGGAGANVGARLTTYNSTKGTNYLLTSVWYPNGDNNYPYDYWNQWVNHTKTTNPTTGGSDNLDTLAAGYDVIVFKHCYPVSTTEPDTGAATVSSSTKSLENYKLQYAALKARMLQFPNKKFIVWTGAARRADDVVGRWNDPTGTLRAADALRAKEFSDWVKNTWDQPGDNIFVWDFFSLETGGNANGYLLDANSAGSNNSHPSDAFATVVAPYFVQRMLDVIEGRGDSGSITGN